MPSACHIRLSLQSHGLWSPPSCPARGISQARILEWVAIFYSRGSSQPRDRTCVSRVFCSGRQILYHYASWVCATCKISLNPLRAEKKKEKEGCILTYPSLRLSSYPKCPVLPGGRISVGKSCLIYSFCDSAELSLVEEAQWLCGASERQNKPRDMAC